MDKRLLAHLKNQSNSLLSGIESDLLEDDLNNFIFDLKELSEQDDMTKTQLMELIKIFNQRISKHLTTIFSSIKTEIATLGNSNTEEYLQKIIPDIKKDEAITNEKN